jgi:transcriptional regulator with XRE-family HTH domain
VSDFTVAYGRRVRTARTAAELTQSQLADRLGVSRSSVANIESGRQQQTIEQAMLTAVITSCDPRWLATGWDQGDPVRAVDAAQLAVRRVLTDIRATLDSLEAGLP